MLTLRHRQACSRAEIIHVSLSHTRALAIYASTNQPSQRWIDTSTIPGHGSSAAAAPGSRNGAGLSKTLGSLAAFSPLGDLCAARRDWTVQLGSGGVEFHHSSTVLVRDVASGKTVIEIKEAQGSLLCWSQDGRLIAAGEEHSGSCSGGNLDRVGVWDAKTGRRVGRVMSHIDTVTHAVFAPASLLSSTPNGDGRGSLVTLSRDGTLRITDPATSRTLSRLEIDSHNPRLLAVSSRCVASIWGARMYIWYPAANDLTSYHLNAARGDAVEGWPLCISPDCRYLACRTEDGFDVMELGSGTVLCREVCSAAVTTGAFSPDSRLLLLGRMDGVLEFWDLADDTSKDG